MKSVDDQSKKEGLVSRDPVKMNNLSVGMKCPGQESTSSEISPRLYIDERRDTI